LKRSSNFLGRIKGALLAAFVAASNTSGTVAAGAASLGAACTAGVLAEAKGNGLPVYAVLEHLEALGQDHGSGEGGSQSVFDVRGLLMRLDLVQELSSRVQDADVYTNRWRAEYTTSCRLQGEKLAIEIGVFNRFDQLISFSRGLFDFVEGDGKSVSFTATEHVAERRGKFVRFADVRLAPGLTLEAEFASWTLKQLQESSIVLEAENQGTPDERWTATVFGRSSLWDPGMSGAPWERYSGNGFSVGAGVAYRPFPWMSATYRIAPIAGRESALKLIVTDFELDTDTEYIGEGGYLWNHPAMYGKIRWEPYERNLAPAHTLEVELGTRPELHVQVSGPWPYGAEIHRAGISLPLGSSGSAAVALVWHAFPGTVQGVLSLRPLVGWKWGEINLSVSLDNLKIAEAGIAGIALEGALHF